MEEHPPAGSKTMKGGLAAGDCVCWRQKQADSETEFTALARLCGETQFEGDTTEMSKFPWAKFKLNAGSSRATLDPISCGGY